MPSPLSGLRVLDLSEDIASSYCARLFALGGAAVVKVERPSGDPVRRRGPSAQGNRRSSGLFAYLNAGKSGVSLDIATSSGRDLILRMVRWADLVIEGFTPRYLPALGLGYEDLRRANADIILTSITPFGQTGPYRDFRATEIGLHAISGEMSMAGDKHLPLKKGGNVAQFLGGLHGFLGSMAALFQGKATHVDVSISEGLTSIIGGPLHERSFGAELQKRRASGLGWPYGIRACKDGYVMVFTSYGNVWWPAFASMISEGESVEPPSSPPPAGEEQDYWDGLLDRWIRAGTREEIVEETQRRGLAFGYLATAPDLLASPQLAHRRFFQDVPIEGTGSLKLTGLPFLVDGERLKFAAAPRHGEHNEAVLCGMLGLSRRDLVVLRASGVV